MDEAWSIRAVGAGCHLPCPEQVDVRVPGAQDEPDFPVLRNDETLRARWSLEMGL